MTPGRAQGTARLGGRAVLLAPAGLALALIVVPILALLARVEWAQLPRHLSAPGVGAALRIR